MAGKDEKLARQQELEDIKWLMRQPQGRRIVWRLLETCGVFRSSFTGNSTTFFNEGRRDVGLELLADINEVAGPEYLQMTQEANSG